MILPRLYPILDRAFLPEAAEGARLDAVERTIVAWLDAGVTLMQYRDKRTETHPREALADAREMVRVCFAHGGEMPTLIMNDRADLMLAAGFDGVHIGQEDLSPEGARRVIGSGRVYGISCHNEAQIAEAEQTDADYLAIGPVFATRSKEKADPMIGVERLEKMRSLTRKPLVAIGGITFANCVSVIDAGADSVAIISGLLSGGAAAAAKSVADFQRVLR